jgi:stage V sporulation protein S
VVEPFASESPVWTPGALSHTSEVVEDVHVADETLPLPTDGLVAGLPSGNGEFLRVDCEVLKVSARSRPSAVAGAIAGVVREHGRAEVQAIGAGATNQAVKAVAIARDYLRETGIEAICLPAFIDVTIENEDRTDIRLVIEPR